MDYECSATKTTDTFNKGFNRIQFTSRLFISTTKSLATKSQASFAH